MTDMPNDPIDPYESRLARRVGAFSDQAVVPIDPVAIASAASLHAQWRSGGGRLFGTRGPIGRFALVGAGALLVIAATGAAIFVGGQGLFAPTQTAGATQAAIGPVATPTAVPGSELAKACDMANLTARVTAWDGAAGHRIATVVVENVGPTACTIWTLAAPQLVDNNGVVLMSGNPGGTPGSLTLASNATATTMVDAANYCGPDPALPLTVAFAFLDGRHLGASPDLNPRDVSDAPPCNGPGRPGDIQMQPFVPGTPG